MGKVLKLLWKIIQLAFIGHMVMGNGNTNIIKMMSLPFAVYSLIGKYLTLQVSKYLFKCIFKSNHAYEGKFGSWKVNFK